MYHKTEQVKLFHSMTDVSVWLHAILISFLKHVLEISKKYYYGCLFINEI